MFDHTLENTLEACGVTARDVMSIGQKLQDEIANKPFTPYTPAEQVALVVLAVGDDANLLVNTLNFVDESIFEAVTSKSEVVEALIKYPPTTEQIYKVLAIRKLSDMMEE